MPDGWQRAGMPRALRLRRAGPSEGSLLGIAGVKPVVGKGRRGSSQVSEGQAGEWSGTSRGEVGMD